MGMIPLAALTLQGAHSESSITAITHIIPIAKPTKSLPSMANRSLPSMANRVSMTNRG